MSNTEPTPTELLDEILLGDIRTWKPDKKIQQLRARLAEMEVEVAQAQVDADYWQHKFLESALQNNPPQTATSTGTSTGNILTAPEPKMPDIEQAAAELLPFTVNQRGIPTFKYDRGFNAELADAWRVVCDLLTKLAAQEAELAVLRQLREAIKPLVAAMQDETTSAFPIEQVMAIISAYDVVEKARR